jgi:acyl-CoA synthetase (AMP-forming)/AMP-acid ligase II/acyl carrier protein
MYKYYKQIMNLITLLQKNSDKYPDHAAYTFLKKGHEKSYLTLSQLEFLAKSVAGELQKTCISGDRAILLYPTGPDFICAFFGCIFAGVIAVPAYPPDPGRFKRSIVVLLSIIHNSQPQKILTTKAYLDMAHLLFSEYPQLNKVDWIATDTIHQNSCFDWKYPDIQKDAIAYLQYTSGSTSSPRGVVITHEATLANLKLGEYLNGFTNESCIAGWVPLYHDLGLIAYVIGTIFHTCKCYLMQPNEFIQQPFQWLNAISTYKATHNAAPPFAYDLCVRKITSDQKKLLDLSSWMVAGIGAEPISYDTLNRFSETFEEVGFKKTSFYPTYGMAEAVLYISGGQPSTSPPILFVETDAFHQGKVITCHPDNHRHGQYITACGQTEADYLTIIVDPETGVQLDDNHIGEIWHSGIGVGMGYFQSDGAINDNAFHHFTTDTNKGPFFRTGDLGFIHDSVLYITGRLKDMIIVRGVKYYPQDIEITVQSSHEELRKGCGAAFSTLVDHQEKLVVVQEIKDFKVNDTILQNIQNAVEIAVARFHDLPIYDLVLIKKGNIPKTSSGKIQRNECKNLYHNQKFSKLNQNVYRKEINVSLSDDYSLQMIQKWLINRLAKSLDILPETIDISVPYTHYAIDSLALSNLTNEIEIQFHISIDLMTLNRYPTLEGLSRYILESI